MWEEKFRTQDQNMNKEAIRERLVFGCISKTLTVESSYAENGDG